MKRKANEATLREVLLDMVDRYKLRGKLDQTKLQKIWPDLVGQAVARHTHEIRVRRRKLYLRIGPPALRQELTYQREKIKSLVNEALGEGSVEDVIIR